LKTVIVSNGLAPDVTGQPADRAAPDRIDLLVVQTYERIVIAIGKISRTRTTSIQSTIRSIEGANVPCNIVKTTCIVAGLEIAKTIVGRKKVWRSSANSSKKIEKMNGSSTSSPRQNAIMLENLDPTERFLEIGNGRFLGRILAEATKVVDFHSL